MLTGVVKWFLYLLLQLLPMSGPHGRVLEVLDQRHGPLERLNTTFQGVTDGPVNLVLARE